jgi:glycine/D-amino acid oxidase-like deaminating enzyme
METQERRNQSLWTGTTPSTSYPPLKGDLTVDVAVVGGGITGLTTALLLKQAGMRVAVIEGNRIAAGSTGYTTAKITSLHDLIYAKLLDELGVERARIYGHANQAAIEQVAKLVDDLEIECDFTRAPAYTYTEKADQREAIEREAEASQRLGLPASLTTETELPFPVEAAVRFEHQAAFHPRAYALALAEAIDGDGSVVLEGTRVKDVDEEDGVCRLKTDHGTMTADQAVIATLLPILDRGGYFAKAAPARSYLIAVRQGGPLPEGMYLSCDSPTRSVRSANGISGDYLLVGGEGHKVGHDDDTTQR